jgi:hypothetical protein
MKPVDTIDRNASIPAKIKIAEATQMNTESSYLKKYLFKDVEGRLFTGKCNTYLNKERYEYEIRRINSSRYSYAKGRYFVYEKYTKTTFSSKFRQCSEVRNLMRITKEDTDLLAEVVSDLI